MLSTLTSKIRKYTETITEKLMGKPGKHKAPPSKNSKQGGKSTANSKASNHAPPPSKHANNKKGGYTANSKVNLRKQRGRRDPARWKDHFAAFNELLLPSSTCLQDIEGDGNCLFRAISDQLFGHQHKYKDLRWMCCDYMKDNKELLQYYLDVDEDMGFDDYVNWIRGDTNWGGYFELYCLGHLLGVNFLIVLKDGSLLEMTYFDEDEARTLVLGFHEDEKNDIPEHYSSIRLIGDNRMDGLSKQIDLNKVRQIKNKGADGAPKPAESKQKHESESSEGENDNSEDGDDKNKGKNSKKKEWKPKEKKQKKDKKGEKVKDKSVKVEETMDDNDNQGNSEELLEQALINIISQEHLDNKLIDKLKELSLLF